MKGKRIFTCDEIDMLRQLIVERNSAPSWRHKTIRQKMRDIGFYGQDDWGIRDLQLSHLEGLIATGRIQIIPSRTVAIKNEVMREKVSTDDRRGMEASLAKILAQFASGCFDPANDTENKLPNSAGNYIICLKNGCRLPPMECEPTFKTFAQLNVLYTGISRRSLRLRDYRQHFKGNNAGRSTLRKSLGVLFGYKLIARDLDSSNGKTKFSVEDEKELTKWMHENLIMYFLVNPASGNTEMQLIEHFNPPFNLKGNVAKVNFEFRQLLSRLRVRKDF